MTQHQTEPSPIETAAKDNYAQYTSLFEHEADYMDHNPEKVAAYKDHLDAHKAHVGADLGRMAASPVFTRDGFTADAYEHTHSKNFARTQGARLSRNNRDALHQLATVEDKQRSESDNNIDK